MNRMIATLAAGMLATAFAIAPAAAQNLPPPGNVNPGSLNSGAEESGAENQPRSYGPMYYGPYGAPFGAGAVAPYYGGSNAFAAQPGVTHGPFGYAPGYGPYGLGTGGAGAIGAED